MTFEQKFERDEKANHIDIWKKSQLFKNSRQNEAGRFEGKRERQCPEQSEPVGE